MKRRRPKYGVGALTQFDWKSPMRSLRTMGLLLLCCGMFLTACQSRTVTKLMPPPSPGLPANLTQCQGGPERPPASSTQRAAAMIILDLEEALADCKRKLEAIKSLMGTSEG